MKLSIAMTSDGKLRVVNEDRVVVATVRYEQGRFQLADVREERNRLPQRPALAIPDDFDPDEEAVRLKQGGCCDPPADAGM